MDKKQGNIPSQYIPDELKASIPINLDILNAERAMERKKARSSHILKKRTPLASPMLNPGTVPENSVVVNTKNQISGVHTYVSIKAVFGKNVKRFRKAKGVSQEELCEKIDVSVKHLSSIERGLTFVSAELLEKLSDSLEVPSFYFFINENENSYTNAIINSLDSLDRIIEKNLLKAIEFIKADLRQNMQ